ncbi:hypothetical protein GWK48_08970 [Metallosphaera tengchongensis]|uniref:Uncharacterized protein n=1 Tax=Metallosphaera tengchongensis TaxID=1532350 RepID=A0A6N0NW99_9CREN|nr:hypothetical protein [Metallosphaera tengchongensis]QKR00485.1 hypothetical protein GWK48_08970 [Metallosphaera tengchongensis]
MIEIDFRELNPLKVIRNNLGECTMYYLSVGDLGDFLVFAFQGKVRYVKLMRPYPGKWTCESALYRPEGLYVFDLGNKSFLEELRRKMEMIPK